MKQVNAIYKMIENSRLGRAATENYQLSVKVIVRPSFGPLRFTWLWTLTHAERPNTVQVISRDTSIYQTEEAASSTHESFNKIVSRNNQAVRDIQAENKQD